MDNDYTYEDSADEYPYEDPIQSEAEPQQDGDEEEDFDAENEREETSIVPIIISLLILVGGLVLIMVLHYKRKLPACCYK